MSTYAAKGVESQLRACLYAPPPSPHTHLDVTSRVESIQLIDELQHGTLHLIIPSCTIIKPRSTNRVDLIKEDNASLLRPRHLKELPHHPRSLTHVLLHQLRSNDTNERRVGTVGDCSSAERLSCTGRAKKENTLGWVDTELDELLWVEERSLDDFAELLNLLFAAAHVAVGNVGLLFDLHHRDRGVLRDVGGEV